MHSAVAHLRAGPRRAAALRTWWNSMSIRVLYNVINVGIIGSNEVRAAIHLPSSIKVDGCICRPDRGWEAGCQSGWGEFIASGKVGRVRQGANLGSRSLCQFTDSGASRMSFLTRFRRVTPNPYEGRRHLHRRRAARLRQGRDGRLPVPGRMEDANIVAPQANTTAGLVPLSDSARLTPG